MMDRRRNWTRRPSDPAHRQSVHLSAASAACVETAEAAHGCLQFNTSPYCSQRLFLLHTNIRLETHGPKTPQMWFCTEHRMTCKHTHTILLRPFYRDYSGEPVPEEIFWTFMMEGKTTEADTTTILLSMTPSGLISGPPPSSSTFTPDALPVTTLPHYPGLGQASNMLACICNGVVDQLHYVNETKQWLQIDPTLLQTMNYLISKDVANCMLFTQYIA